MSLDMALLDMAEGCGESWFRLYQWEPHCLSFGRHEPASRTYDIDRIRSLGLDAVRRPTGGRAVWHAREVTYAVAAPWQIFGSLRAAYLEIHRLLSEALGTVGIATSLAPRVQTAPLDSGGCFSQPVGGEVLANGRKMVGSAQLRRGSAFLQHGSILLEGDQRLVASLARHPSAGDHLPDVSTLSSPMPPEEVAHRIAECAASQWAGPWERVSDPALLLQAAATYGPQFQSSTWTWAR
jgi:lipoate-protein ligase A